MWSVWTVRPYGIPDYISPSTVLTSLPCQWTLVFHDLMSVYAVRSENVTADVASDASFIQGMGSDNPEEAADYKCWQHLSFSKIDYATQHLLSLISAVSKWSWEVSRAGNHLNPAAYYMHEAGGKSIAFKTYSLSLHMSSSPVLGNSLCNFTALGLWIVTNFSHSGFCCFLALWSLQLLFPSMALSWLFPRFGKVLLLHKRIIWRIVICCCAWCFAVVGTLWDSREVQHQICHPCLES